MRKDIMIEDMFDERPVLGGEMVDEDVAWY